jgi:hypothetical protein
MHIHVPVEESRNEMFLFSLKMLTRKSHFIEIQIDFLSHQKVMLYKKRNTAMKHEIRDFSCIIT